MYVISILSVSNRHRLARLCLPACLLACSLASMPYCIIAQLHRFAYVVLVNLVCFALVWFDRCVVASSACFLACGCCLLRGRYIYIYICIHTSIYIYIYIRITSYYIIRHYQIIGFILVCYIVILLLLYYYLIQRAPSSQAPSART